MSDDCSLSIETLHCIKSFKDTDLITLRKRRLDLDLMSWSKKEKFEEKRDNFSYLVQLFLKSKSSNEPIPSSRVFKVFYNVLFVCIGCICQYSIWQIKQVNVNKTSVFGELELNSQYNFRLFRFNILGRETGYLMVFLYIFNF